MKRASGEKKKAVKRRSAGKKAKEAKPADLGAVRQKITRIVSGAAENITKKLVNRAVDGELAHSRYLFEMAGVYPAGEAVESPAEEDSLAKTLLERMGLPTTPVVDDESEEEEAEANEPGC